MLRSLLLRPHCFSRHALTISAIHTRGGFHPVLGIKRETVNLWEQRSPLTPSHIKQIVDDGTHVLIQPDNRRCFTPGEYEEVGATVTEDLSEATLILGVKRPTELRREDLLPEKTYAFFTHTIKAQSANMTLLDTLLDRKIRIIDYECMVNRNKKRLVAFGKYAGIAGTLDILHGIGIRLLAMGHTTPFLQVSLAHNYVTVDDAQRAVKLAGYEISRGNLPDSIGPLTFVVNGTGNVSIGVQQVLQNLPVKWITVDELKDVTNNYDKRYVYVCVTDSEDYMDHKDGKPFNLDEYREQPENFRSTFAEKVGPYMSVLINGTYWDARIDRILTRGNVKSLLNVKPKCSVRFSGEGCPQLPHRLIAICDISADPGGSVQFTDECTTIDEPFCLYDPKNDTILPKIVGDGILMCSIDNMPAQLPFEASKYFGDKLMPFLGEMLKSDATKPFDHFEASPAVKNAVITSNGELTPNFQYISQLRKKNERLGLSTTSTKRPKQVLILGSGYVSPPLIDYLLRDKNIQITLVSNAVDELNEIHQTRPQLRTRVMNILEDKHGLSSLISDHDLVISLIPWKYHPVVAEQCIMMKRNMLTASYCTPALKALEVDFKQANITAFMEIGLDPGIDHLLTKDSIDDIASKGGRLVSYRSFTGGLPAPEHSNNPLRYKFSWSPEAAMSTVMNGATYLENGKICEVPPDGSLMRAAKNMGIFPGFNLEGYPNRDSTRYIDLYHLKGCETVIRGTLRYTGYTEAVSFLLDLGLLDGNQQALFMPGTQKYTWRQLISQKLGITSEPNETGLRAAILSKVSNDQSKFNCLNDLGFLSEDPVEQTGTPLSSTSLQLSKVLTYGPNERDLIVMAHELIIDWPAQKQRETRNVVLVAYGKAGKGKAGLAMSQTVGIPSAIAARMILDGEVTDKGIVLPLKRHIYKPILQRLKEEGIEAQETSSFTAL